MKKGNKAMAAVLAALMVFGNTGCGNTGSSAGDSSSQADSQDAIVISVAHNLMETTPEHQNLVKFKETIEAESNGAMVVQLYPNGTLGGDATNLESVQDGNLTMTFSSTATEGNYVPECEMFDIPFLFDSKEEGRKVMADETFSAALDEKFQKVGFKLVGATAVGFRWMTCNKPVNSMADLSGIKIRTMENPNHIALWNALGANATPISGSELFTALQQGTVDAQENPVSNIYNGKIYEVNDQLIDVRHILNIAGWVVNLDWYNGLSEENRAIFDKAVKTCISQTDQDADATEEEYIRAMEEEHGMHVIYLDESVRQKMRQAASDVEVSIRSHVGNDLIDSLYTAIGR